MFERSPIRFTLCFASCALLASPADSEVTDSAAGGFTLERSLEIAAPPAKVYQAMVHEVGAWWDPEHTHSGDARNLSIEARPNGCFCEELPSGGVRHLTVSYLEPGKLVRLSGGLGPLQQLGVAGSMSWSFVGSNGATLLRFTYSVGGYKPGGLDSWAAPIDSVWEILLGRLKRYIETGSPEPNQPG